ncbi:hypothetical protein V7968_20490 [Nocardia vulneris]|uniref:hypothetical protein n=1 Tax=Nocardia vulneris TaxID=1141657 RepID=UPI0030CDDC98
MSAALLAALAGVAGLMVGRYWDSRSESNRWQRDQKVITYQRLADQFDVVLGEIRKPLVSEPNADVYESIWIERRTVWSEWLSAVAGIWLHGSTGVVEATATLDKALAALEMAVAEKHITTIEEWKLARVAVHDAFAGFIKSAREDLSLPPVPVTYFDHYPPALGES